MNSIATLVVLTAFCTAGILLLACVAAAINNRPHGARKPKPMKSQFSCANEKRRSLKEGLHESPSLAPIN